MEESQALKDCPCCGGSEKVTILTESVDMWQLPRREWDRVVCLDCEIMTPPYDLREDAVAHWNRWPRKADAMRQGIYYAIGRLEEIIDEGSRDDCNEVRAHLHGVLIEVDGQVDGMEED